MKLKLGKSGILEGICAAAIAMCANGMFDVDAGYAYEKGNTTYISIPLSALSAALVFILAAKIMKEHGIKSLCSLFQFAFGKVLAVAASVLICASLIFCAAEPLANLTQVLDGAVYEGVEYPALLAFILPVTIFIAFKGMETIARTAKVFAALLVLSVAAAFVLSLPGQQSYRLYPLPGDSAGHFVRFTLSQWICFLPPLAVLLIAAPGLHGTEHAEKIGISSAVITAIICFAAQFMLARLYSYKALGSLFVPLCRVRYLSLERSYAMWLDKLLIMAWLIGCMVSSAYCIYGAALIYANAFGQGDVGPAVIFVSLAVCTCVLLEFGMGIANTSVIHDIVIRWGSLGAFVPIAAASAFAAVKGKRKKAVRCEGKIIK